MATSSAPKPAASRRALPPARLANPQYEIVFRRRSSPGSVFASLLAALRGGVSWGTDALGAAYARGARLAFERIEAVEDAAAERRFHAHAAAEASVLPARQLAGPSHPE